MIKIHLMENIGELIVDMAVKVKEETICSNNTTQ